MARNGQIPARRPKNGPPSSQMGTYLKTEGIQSCLRIWGIYDPIELGPFEPKNGGLYGCSVKKIRFSGQKRALVSPQEFVQQHDQHKNVVFLVSRHDGSKKNGGCPQ